MEQPADILPVTSEEARFEVRFEPALVRTIKL